MYIELFFSRKITHLQGHCSSTGVQMGQGEQIHQNTHSIWVHYFLHIFLQNKKCNQDRGLEMEVKWTGNSVDFTTYPVENEFVEEEDESVSFKFVSAL